MNNQELYEQAKIYMPGGVNSPVRAFNAVDSQPLIIEKAKGAYISDVEGNTYIDYIMSWGPLILGHADEMLLSSLNEAAAKGFSYGVTSEIEITMAKQVVDAYPGLEQIRMVNSGTEATMSAIRLAKGYTRKNKIIKFEGCYHGHSDQLLVKSGSGTITYQQPTSLGVSQETIADTLVATYNDIESVKSLIEANKDDIATIIIEPIAGNMGLVYAKKDFLQQLRELCTQNNIVLIFDEVISGFRVSYQGSYSIYGISPDLVCFGKIIGAGLPVGAYGGKKEIMALLAPNGPVYQAGTLSGNPLAMHVGLSLLSKLKNEPEIYQELERKANILVEGFKNNIKNLNLNYQVVSCGSLITFFFLDQVPNNYQDVAQANTKAYAKYHRLMQEQGILLPPAQFEAMFISLAHTEEDLEKTIEANYQALQQL